MKKFEIEINQALFIELGMSPEEAGAAADYWRQRIRLSRTKKSPSSTLAGDKAISHKN